MILVGLLTGELTLHNKIVTVILFSFLVSIVRSGSSVRYCLARSLLPVVCLRIINMHIDVVQNRLLSCTGGGVPMWTLRYHRI